MTLRLKGRGGVFAGHYGICIRARGERANWGGANMRVVHGGHFWQLGSIASLATETTGG